MIIQLLILAAALIAAPILAGGVFSGTRGGKNLPLRWASGQMLLWAGFEIISVPLILKERAFNDVVRIFLFYTAIAILLALLSDMRYIKKNKGLVKKDAEIGGNKDSLSMLLWICVIVLLLLQLVLACVLAYEEGDDAYYVGISTITADADTMYRKLPYTGGYTEPDVRHSLAPFPIWVAFLSRISGMQAVTVAQIILPVVLIVMCYSVYFMIGMRLFQDTSRKLSLFMLILECLVMFGGYSLYTAENFLLVRTAQGKAVLANIILPFLFLLFFQLLEKLEEKEKAGGGYWTLLACTMASGCLCSTQGTLLTGMLLGIVGACTVVCYRKWNLILPLICCCVLPGVVALLYLWLKA